MRKFNNSKMSKLATTKSGTPCKLCKKKGDLCHVHENSRENFEPKKTRCWRGYEPVPGKKPYSKGSCRKVK